MADTFGLKIGLEGEKEFKKALAEINQSFKVLGSEMKLVESQFSKSDNSVEALTARNQVLNKEIEAQKQKIETLRQALANAAESFGENDRRTQAWQIQLNNAQAALNGMERELADNEAAMDELGKEMDDTGNSADDLEEELDDAGDAADDSEGKFSKLGGTLKTVGVAMGACVAAAAAAAVSLGKAVVEAYGEYEQLVGGVDTLFKDSSAALQEYANNAYKTAGMSANDYMSTVTSFSASLISSLGGDTEAAVKYADMAITDMADNANKMGTDIGLIQNAYQGFAKQNYTMLDNLKLGYGGTKTEMERLLADAQAISGIEYNIESYADVVDAIHVIQESMGVAGATNGFEVLPEAIRQHTDWDYAYQQRLTGCSLKPTFRNMPYRNSFVPEIEIVISNRDSQTELQLIGQPIKSVRVFMALWFSFLLVMEVFFIVLAITSNLDRLFPLFIPLAMCAFGYLLCKLATKATFNSVVKAIKKEFY